MKTMGMPVRGCVCLLVAGMAIASQAERVERKLTEWTVDGKKVTVPHCWNLKDGCDGPGRTSSHQVDDWLWDHDSVGGWGYERKSVTYRCELGERPQPGRRLFVRCEGASVSAKIVFNGHVVAKHEGAFTAFAAELTPYLMNHENTLEINVDNFWDGDIPPLCADYTVCGGLYRPVTLIETDGVCIDPVTDGADGVRLDADPKTGRVTARISVLGGEDEVQTFEFGKVELWSPENPKLYQVKVRIEGEGYEDSITKNVAFRTVEFKEDGFYLNGKKRFLRGVNYHQERAGRGWAITAEDIREDVALIREMGCDAVRTTHYPHSGAFFDEADRTGLIVWTELPATDKVGRSARYRENLMRTVREMVAQLGDHPSIAMWSIFNEMYLAAKNDGSAEPLLEEAKALFRKLDPTRHTVAASCRLSPTCLRLNSIPDALAVNEYPGWYGDRSEALGDVFTNDLVKTSRASLAVSEFGCGGSIYHHENPLRGIPVPQSFWHPEEYETQHHRIQYAVLKDQPACWGVYMWMMFDAAADQRNEGDQPGINDKGLVTRDRRTRKDAFYFYKANWNPEPMLHLCGKRNVRKRYYKPQDGLTDEVIDVLAFSTVGEVTLYVNGEKIGTRAPDKVKCVEWKRVPLKRGLNTIKVEAGGRTEAFRTFMDAI